MQTSVCFPSINKRKPWFKGIRGVSPKRNLAIVLRRVRTAHNMESRGAEPFDGVGSKKVLEWLEATKLIQKLF